MDQARRPGLFWLTGSQQFHLIKGVSESLAGRVGVVQLLGLSRRELLRQASRSRPFLPRPERIRRLQASGGRLALKPLFEMIWRGSFPALALEGYWHNGLAAPFYYYRDRDGREVDLLIVRDREIYPLEIKKTAAPSRDDARHFQSLARLQLPVGHGGVICLAQDFMPLGAAVHAIPVGAL